MATIVSKLQGGPEGSFLVHGSQKEEQKEEQYALFVRMGGAYEIIHICRSKKKYGFFDTLKNKPVLVKFPTIPALVEHFRRVPLTKYNPRINVTLAHPISRYAEVSNYYYWHFANLLSTGWCC
jgi:phosphoinositide-3-kinase regulatory subunit